MQRVGVSEYVPRRSRKSALLAAADVLYLLCRAQQAVRRRYLVCVWRRVSCLARFGLLCSQFVNVISVAEPLFPPDVALMAPFKVLVNAPNILPPHNAIPQPNAPSCSGGPT